MPEATREKILKIISEAAIEVNEFVNTEDEEIEDFDFRHKGLFKKIEKDEVRVGDYIYSDGGFFYKIVNIFTRYDVKTGQSYKVGKLEDDGYTFRIDDRKIIKGPKKFLIYDYYRLKTDAVAVKE